MSALKSGVLPLHGGLILTAENFLIFSRQISQSDPVAGKEVCTTIG
jgi:hypothetical protein